MHGNCEQCGTNSRNLETYKATVPYIDLCPTCLHLNQATAQPRTGAEHQPVDNGPHPRVMQVHPPRHGKSHRH